MYHNVCFECRHELKKASHVTKLPKGKHSVKGEELNCSHRFCWDHFYKILMKTVLNVNIVLKVEYFSSFVPSVYLSHV